MILRAGPLMFTIADRRRVTHETFTRYFKLARLAANIETARRELDSLPENQRRRQREKIKRLERQYDQTYISD